MKGTAPSGRPLHRSHRSGRLADLRATASGPWCNRIDHLARIGEDGADAGPSPTGLKASTSKVYGPGSTEKVNVTDRVAGLAVLTDCTIAPRLLRTVAVYPVMADPPLPAAGTPVQFTVAVNAPPAAPCETGGSVAVPSTGATVGAEAGVTEADATDGAPDPLALVAKTRKVYAVPLVSPVIVVLVPVLVAVATTAPAILTWIV